MRLDNDRDAQPSQEVIGRRIWGGDVTFQFQDADQTFKALKIIWNAVGSDRLLNSIEARSVTEGREWITEWTDRQLGYRTYVTEGFGNRPWSIRFRKYPDGSIPDDVATQLEKQNWNLKEKGF